MRDVCFCVMDGPRDCPMHAGIFRRVQDPRDIPVTLGSVELAVAAALLKAGLDSHADEVLDTVALDLINVWRMGAPHAR